MGKKHKHQKSGVAEKAVDVRKLWQDGLTRFQQGHYQKAAAEWQKIPSTLRDASISAALAETHFRKALANYPFVESDPEKTYQQIISELAHAINVQPDKALYHFHLGLAYHRHGKLDKAIAAYRKACQLQPNARYLFHLIIASLKKNDLQNAAEHIKLCGEGFHRELLGIAIALLKKESPRVSTITNAATLPEAHLFGGLLRLMDDQPREAIAKFEQALILIQSERNVPSATQSILFYYLGLAQRAAAPDDAEASEKNWEQAVLCGAGLQKQSIKDNLVAMLWEQGLKLAGAGKYLPAFFAWEKALALRPHHKSLLQNVYRLRFLMGNEAARRGDFAEAIKLWQAIPLQSDANLFHNIAMAYDQLQKPREANSHWLEVIKYWKREYRGDADKSWLKEYLKIAHKHLAQNYLKLGEPQSAIRELQEVLRFDSDDTECHQRLGDLYIEMENWPPAQREFETLLRLKPNDTDVSLNLAFALEMNDEMDTARSMLENVLKSEPNHARAKKQLGDFLHEYAHECWKDGEYDEAGDLFKQQIKLDPLNFSGYKCWAGVLIDDEMANENDADQVLQSYIAVHLGSPAAYVEVGVTYSQAGNHRKAEQYFKQAEKIGVTDAGLLIKIGKAYLPISANKAKKYFEQAVQASPHNAKLCFEIGSNLGLTHPELALGFLQKGLKIDGSNAGAYAEMGLVQAVLGNLREADKTWFMAKQLAGQQGNRELLKTIAEMQKQTSEIQEIFDFLR